MEVQAVQLLDDNIGYYIIESLVYMLTPTVSSEKPLSLCVTRTNIQI